MKMVIVSGKGGTGKTMLAASLASLTSSDVITVDADVDASNLPIILKGKDIAKKDFSGAKVAAIATDTCSNCLKCMNACRFDAITRVDEYPKVNPMMCEGCGACRQVCDSESITLLDEKTASINHSRSNKGDLIYANMHAGAEGSGKLVTELRKQAEASQSVMILDGSPGIGCPVIASVINTDLAVIVTEPSLSGISDLKRIMALLNSMSIDSKIIVNKFDIHLEGTAYIESIAKSKGIEVIGRIPFDECVMESVNQCKPLVELSESKAKDALLGIYERSLRRYFE